MLAIVGQEQNARGAGEDRRVGASRERLLMRVAKVICASGEYPCIVRDVSETGAKLQLFHRSPPDVRVLIELAGGAVYAAERRWTRDGIGGFRFIAPIEIDEFVNERHRAARRPIRLRTGHEIAYAAAGERGHAMLVNLSARGACIEAGRPLPVGSALRIEIAGWPPRFASVCWRKDFRHGLVFQDDMTLANFARLALDLQPFAPAPQPGQRLIA